MKTSLDEYRDLLCTLISIPSVNPMGLKASGPEYFETALTDFLEDWLLQYDVEVRRQPVAPGRENLLATYHSPSSTEHILLEVHQDTVPADGMVDPFQPRVGEGSIVYGRGACDNKGPMTAMLLALRRLAIEKPAGAATVTLALTVDEEHTFLGVQRLVKENLGATCAIVAEPTDLAIVVAHKGTVRWDINTAGKACHSSAPERGINAVYRMAHVVSALEEFAAQLSRRPEDPLLGRPTINVGSIQGGICANIVPDDCRIQIDRRLIPGETPAGAHHEVAELLSNHPRIDFPVVCGDPWLHLPPMPNTMNSALAKRLSECVTVLKGPAKTEGVPYGTDASTISKAGIPAVVFGPGSITKAHTNDESVPLEEVALASEILFHFCRDGVV